MMGRPLRHFLNDERGSPAVEMALVLPLLLVLVFTCLEGSYYLYLEHQIVKGVRDGARFAARQAFNKYTCSTIDSNVETTVKNVTRTGSTSNSANPRVPGWTAAYTTVAVTCSNSSTNGIYYGMTGAPQVKVSATVPYPSLFSALSGIGVSVNLKASQQAAVMGI